MGFQFPEAALRGTPMKASFVNDLRDKVNIARDEVGWNPINWGPDLTNDDVIRASHMNELRDRIRELWVEEDLIDNASEFPSYTDGQPTLLKASSAPDVTDNRIWLNLFQDRNTLQGIDVYSNDSRWGPDNSDPRPGPIIGDQILADLFDSDTGLSSNLEFVRCKVIEPFADSTRTSTVSIMTPNEPTDCLANYKKCFTRYQVYGGVNRRVFVVFPPEYMIRPGLNINADLDLTTPEGFTFTNAYINAFRTEIHAVMSSFRSVGVQDYLISNEPNHVGVNVENFAALLYACRPPSGTDWRMYWGGILIAPQDGGIVDAGAINFIKGVFSSFNKTGRPAVAPNKWWWRGITIHIHLNRPETPSILDKVNEARSDGGEDGELLVGEWGTFEEDWPASPPPPPDDQIMTMYDRLARKCTAMSYFAHVYRLETVNGESKHWGVRPVDAQNVSVPGGTEVQFVPQPQGSKTASMYARLKDALE